MNKVTTSSLQREIDLIKLRNSKVEGEKAWETSMARKVSIAILTYITVVIFLLMIKVEKPLIGAIVPTLGFLLSTLSLPFVKEWWLDKQKKT